MLIGSSVQGKQKYCALAMAVSIDVFYCCRLTEVNRNKFAINHFNDELKFTMPLTTFSVVFVVVIDRFLTFSTIIRKNLLFR